MAKYAVFFAGTGQLVRSEKFVYSAWANELYTQGYFPILCDGVGKFRGTNKLTGAGWAKIVEHAMEGIEGYKVRPAKVIIVGTSRGGVQSLVLAHCIRKRWPAARCFVFAIDPVQGAHPQNSGSFDLRDNRNFGRRVFKRTGSRDELKNKYNLGDAAPNTVPDNVDFYLTALMQFRGSSRGFGKFGFTPQAPSLGNVHGLQIGRHATYEIPGDHCYGSYSGVDEQGDNLDEGRYARGRVTREMFAHHCVETRFGHVEFDCPLATLNYYCKIANQDLAGSQGQDRSSGHSFLEASRAAQTFGSQYRNPAASHGWAKGRGHIVASTQAIGNWGYFINERHRRIYQDTRAFVEGCIARQQIDFFQLYENIAPWFERQARFGIEVGQDRERFQEFIQALRAL